MATAQSLKALNKADKAQVGKKDLYTVDPRLLEEEQGFNARGAFDDNYFERPDVRAHIDGFKQSYRNGDYVPPILVKVVDGRILIREGHCRTRALKELLDEGVEIQKVNVEPLQGDETNQLAIILTSNDSLPLTHLERASVYVRLSAYGLSDGDIAAKVHRTPEHVRQLKQMLEMPFELKTMVQNGDVSAHLALELFREHGTSATDKVREALEQQSGEGKTKKKVTRGSVQGRPRMTRKVVDSMRSTFESLAARVDEAEPAGEDRYRLEVSSEELEQIRQLREQLSAPEGEQAGEAGDGQ